MRKYSVAEIMGMRRALEIILRPTGAYYPTEVDARVELQLNTYMAQGVEPAELDEQAQQMMRARYTMFPAVNGGKGGSGGFHG